MGNTKTQIGKILLEKKRLSQEQLSKALLHQKSSGKKLASSLLELGLTREEDLLIALGEQMGLPAVDLSRSIIPLRFLDIVPESVAKEAQILPLLVENDRVVLAMSVPDDQQTIDEMSFITGKKIEFYIALEIRLKQVVREAYAVHKRDPNVKFYYGEKAVFPNNQENPDGFIALVTQELPEPDASIETDGGMVVIEVGLEDEVLEEITVNEDVPLILVVDDEPDIISLLEKALSAEGFRVVSASRGREALQAVKKYRPNLIILDAMLPEIHGFDICKKIKTNKGFSHIPVIIVSAVYRGWRFAEDVKQTYCADDYFEKPFRIVPLVSRIRELLNTGSMPMEEGVDQVAADQAYRKGVELYQKKRYEEGEKALREACRLDPFSPIVHYALANVLLARNQMYDAIREYERTIELKPDLFAPLKNLAILYQKKGFKNKAVEMWERALRCSPDDKTRQEVKAQLLKLF